MTVQIELGAIKFRAKDVECALMSAKFPTSQDDLMMFVSDVDPRRLSLILHQLSNKNMNSLRGLKNLMSEDCKHS